MLGMASPRKPRVAMAASCPSSLILEVACRSMQSSTSSPSMPSPLSATRNRPGAAAFDMDIDAGGAGVHTVFQQLLDHRGRPLHHLAGGDLVG